MHLYSSVEQHKGLEVNLPAASEVVVVIAFIVFSVPKQFWLKCFNKYVTLQKSDLFRNQSGNIFIVRSRRNLNLIEFYASSNSSSVCSVSPNSSTSSVFFGKHEFKFDFFDLIFQVQFRQKHQGFRV